MYFKRTQESRNRIYTKPKLHSQGTTDVKHSTAHTEHIYLRRRTSRWKRNEEVHDGAFNAGGCLLWRTSNRRLTARSSRSPSSAWPWWDVVCLFWRGGSFRVRVLYRLLLWVSYWGIYHCDNVIIWLDCDGHDKIGWVFSRKFLWWYKISFEQRIQFINWLSDLDVGLNDNVIEFVLYDKNRFTCHWVLDSWW